MMKIAVVASAVMIVIIALAFANGDESSPTRHIEACEGIIGSVVWKKQMLGQVACIMQGKTFGGGMTNGEVCTGTRNAALSAKYFDEPTRNFTCSDKKIFENGVYLSPSP